MPSKGWRSGRDVVCAREECNVVFYVYPSDIERGKRFCSQSCCKAELAKPFYGSRHLDVDGYVRVRMPDHPNATKDGRITEHALVMSELLGRPLLPTEEVHHKNGIRDDNAPSNLELWTRSKQPAGSRVEDRIAWAIEFLQQYGYEVK